MNVTRKDPGKWTIEGHISPTAATPSRHDPDRLSDNSESSFDTHPTRTTDRTTAAQSVAHDTPHRTRPDGLLTEPRARSSSPTRAELGSDPTPLASGKLSMAASSPVGSERPDGPVEELVCVCVCACLNFKLCCKLTLLVLALQSYR